MGGFVPAAPLITRGPVNVWYAWVCYDLGHSMGLLHLSLSRLATAIAALAVVIGGISWWQMEPATRSLILDTLGRVIGWLLAVVAIPFLSLPLIGWVARRESNAAGAVFIAVLTAVEGIALFWLFDFDVPGAMAGSLAIAAILLAGVYNLLLCDWLAERMEG